MRSNQAYIPQVAGDIGFSIDDVAYISTVVIGALNNMAVGNPVVTAYRQETLVNGYNNDDFDAVVELTCGILDVNGLRVDEHSTSRAAEAAILFKSTEFAVQDHDFYTSVPENIRIAFDETMYKYDDMRHSLQNRYDTVHARNQRQHVPNYAQQNNYDDRRFSNNNNGGYAPAPRRDTRTSAAPRLSNQSGFGNSFGGGGNRVNEGYNQMGGYNQNRGGGLPLGAGRSVAAGMTAPAPHNRGAVYSADDFRGRGRNNNTVGRESGAAREMGFGGDAVTQTAAQVQHRGIPQGERFPTRQDNQNVPDRSNYVQRDAHLNNNAPQKQVGNNDNQTGNQMAEALRTIQQLKQDAVTGLTPYGNEVIHKLPSGKVVLILKATKANAEGYTNKYCKFPPMTPLDLQAWYILNENKEIVDLITLDNKDYDMEKSEHETARFFQPWGTKTSLPDTEATSRELAKMQVKAQVEEIEKALVEEYDMDSEDFVKLPEDKNILDIERLHVINKDDMATIDKGDDLVGVGRRMLLESVGNEEIKELYREAVEGAEVVPVNYHAMTFYNWTLGGRAAEKALELRGLNSFPSIRRKLYELSDILPSSTMRLIDSIATEWVNNVVHTRFGYDKEAINSFMLDIEGLLDFFEANDAEVLTRFKQMASNLVTTVLYPHTTSDEYVLRAMGATEDEDSLVVFGEMSNITIMNLDSDLFAVNAEMDGGTVTKTSWSSLHSVIEIIKDMAKPQVANYYLSTRDNCKMKISITNDVGVYLIERA